MPAVKAVKPLDIFTREQWSMLTAVSAWKGAALIAHAWASIIIIAWGGALLWQWNMIIGLIAAPIIIALLGGRQLGLAILMHDAAHGALHPKRKVNNFLGQWFAGDATGADLQSYRAYHLTHHRFTQQAEDPDLGLSAPFPTSRASMRRKIIRDLTGQTFFKQRSFQISTAWVGIKAMLSRNISKSDKRDTSAGTVFNQKSRSGVAAPITNVEGAIETAKTMLRFMLIQAIILTISLAIVGWLPFLFWIIALATTFQLFLRIRNIAEHACAPVGSDDPFSHARTTKAGLLARATVAPYYVNYHCEHHLFMGVPCYNLPLVHDILRPHHDKMKIEKNYADVMRIITQTS